MPMDSKTAERNYSCVAIWFNSLRAIGILLFLAVTTAQEVHLSLHLFVCSSGTYFDFLTQTWLTGPKGRASKSGVSKFQVLNVLTKNSGNKD